MKRTIPFYIINVILLVTLAGCRHDPLDVDVSHMDLEIPIHRFDREIFTMDMDTVDAAIGLFYEEYGDFFDVYNVHVINIGPASQKYYGSYLSMFVNDPTNIAVYNDVQEVFGEMESTQAELTDAFRRYLVHFPDSAAPQVVTFVGGFNHKLVTVGQYIGIGLDQYLGRDYRFYDMLRNPEYMQYNQHPGKIPSDVALAWGAAKFPYNDSVDNVLNRMIYNGMLLYFTDALLPGMADSLKIGFHPGQMKWCRNNESQMWTYLVEHKLLFENDPLVMRKLTEAAPNTYYFTSESPGRAAVWLGWQIVREYMRRNTGTTVAGLMQMTDYQKILSGSKYRPG
jgi:hypothetical protein